MDDTNVDYQDRDDSEDFSISGQYLQINRTLDKLREDYFAKRTNPEDADIAIRGLMIMMDALKESPQYLEHQDRWFIDPVWIFPLKERIQAYHEEILNHDMPTLTEFSGQKRDDIPYSTIPVDRKLLKFLEDDSAALEERRYELEDLEAELDGGNDALAAEILRKALKSRNRPA